MKKVSLKGIKATQRTKGKKIIQSLLSKIELFRKLPPRQKVIIISLPLLALVGVISWLAVQAFYKHDEEDEISDVITFSTETPDENLPGEDYKWKGAENDPKYIRLNSIEIGGYIQKVGVDQHGQIAVPTNVHIAGWYVDTVRPGEKGLSIIDGHVDGTSVGGIFRNLKNLKQSDEYEVELGNGQILKYKVIEVLTFKTEEASNYLFSQEPNVKSQLNLITCGGNFDKTLRTYDQRIIVYSELIE